MGREIQERDPDLALMGVSYARCCDWLVRSEVRRIEASLSAVSRKVEETLLGFDVDESC